MTNRHRAMMANLYRFFATAVAAIQSAFAVTAAIEIRRRPKDADPRRVGSDQACFTTCR